MSTDRSASCADVDRERPRHHLLLEHRHPDAADEVGDQVEQRRQQHGEARSARSRRTVLRSRRCGRSRRRGTRSSPSRTARRSSRRCRSCRSCSATFHSRTPAVRHTTYSTTLNTSATLKTLHVSTWRTHPRDSTHARAPRLAEHDRPVQRCAGARAARAPVRPCRGVRPVARSSGCLLVPAEVEQVRCRRGRHGCRDHVGRVAHPRRRRVPPAASTGATAAEAAAERSQSGPPSASRAPRRPRPVSSAATIVGTTAPVGTPSSSRP